MTVYYAIGDIHGEEGKLARLHDIIFDDSARLGCDFTIIHVGDLIDRGPDSRGVIERIIQMERKGAVRSATLKGNHEAMMLSAVDSAWTSDNEMWSRNGGNATLASYERVKGRQRDWRDAIDREHLVWLRNLPVTYRDEDRRIVFVHAGIDPWRFPECTDEVRLWTRSRTFFETSGWPQRPELAGLLVVHGHTPTDDFEPHRSEQRINIDTGVCYGGPLTCVVLAPGEKPRFLSVAPR